MVACFCLNTDRGNVRGGPSKVLEEAAEGCGEATQGAGVETAEDGTGDTTPTGGGGDQTTPGGDEGYCH